MKLDKSNLYTTQQIAYSLNMAKSSIEYRLQRLGCTPINSDGQTNYYSYDDYLKVRNFTNIEIVEVAKVEIITKEIHWAFAPSRMNFEEIDTTDLKLN